MLSFLRNILVGCFYIFVLFAFTTSAFSSGGNGNPPDATQSTFVASPTSIPPDGVTATTITITLKNAAGTPLAGDTVSWSSSNDLTAVFSTSSAVLNANGTASFTMTSTQAGTTSIDVTDSPSATTLLNFGQVQVTNTTTTTTTTTTTSGSGGSGTGGPACNQLNPSGAPNLYAAYKNSNHTSVTLYFVPPPAPYDGFTISYGLTQGADAYTVSFSQGQSTGAIKYVVNSLIKNAPYYFKVRANNGCAGGPWSNVRSSSAAVSSLPATGPENIFLEIGIAGAVAIITGAVLVFAL